MKSTFENLPQQVDHLLARVNRLIDINTRQLTLVEKKSKYLTLDKVLDVFVDYGIPITKSKLYKMTHYMRKNLSFSIVGNRLVFDRAELIQWIENLLQSNNKNESIMKTIKSAQNMSQKRNKYARNK